VDADEYQGEFDDGGERWSVREAPRQGSEQKEEGEGVGEGGVGSVPGVSRLYVRISG